MEKIEFETFYNFDYYKIQNLTQSNPSAGNFNLNYRKCKVTIEPIEESNEILIERLESMLEMETNYKDRDAIENEIAKLKKTFTSKQ